MIRRMPRRLVSIALLVGLVFQGLIVTPLAIAGCAGTTTAAASADCHGDSATAAKSCCLGGVAGVCAPTCAPAAIPVIANFSVARADVPGVVAFASSDAGRLAETPPDPPPIR
jgi:hypothetical protein